MVTVIAIVVTVTMMKTKATESNDQPDNEPGIMPGSIVHR